MNENLHQYFPEQYTSTHTYVCDIEKNLNNFDLSSPNILSELRDFIQKQTKKEGRSIDPSSQEFIDETTTLFLLLKYFRSGKNIFDIKPCLSEMLRETDIHDIIFDFLNLPYSTFYFHFGAGSSIKLPGNFLTQWHQGEKSFTEDKKYILDGALVSKADKGSFKVILTFINTNLSLLSDQQDFIPVIWFTLSAKGSNPSLSLYDCLFTLGSGFFEHLKGKHIAFPFSLLVDYSKQNGKEVNDEKAGFLFLYNALVLIVNSLCYVNSTDKHIITTSTNDRAAKLLSQIEGTDIAVEKKKYQKDLKKLRYTKIYLCGMDLRSEASSDDTGRQLKPHNRRGHWRNQRYGPDLSLSRLIWIKPVTVRKDKGEPLSGHIYEAH